MGIALFDPDDSPRRSEPLAAAKSANLLKSHFNRRAGLAADRVPRVYLDARSRLNCQKPERVSEFHEAPPRASGPNRLPR